jgi:hypothetical protein
MCQRDEWVSWLALTRTLDRRNLSIKLPVHQAVYVRRQEAAAAGSVLLVLVLVLLLGALGVECWAYAGY